LGGRGAPLGRTRHRWEGNIKSGFSRNRMWCLDWIWLRIGTDEGCSEGGDKLSG